MEFHKPDFSGEGNKKDESLEPTATGSTAPHSPGHSGDHDGWPTETISPGHSKTENEVDGGPTDGIDSRLTRKVTAEDKRRTSSTKKLENTPTAHDWAGSLDHGVVQEKPKKNPKIYVHHKHARKLTKIFTAGTAHLHLPFHHRRSHSDEKAAAHDADGSDGMAEPKPVSFWHNLWIMCSTFPYWNMAFWSGWSYTVGSALFIISTVFAWVPKAFPGVENESLDNYGSPLCFFFGALLYQVGAVMAYLEAINDGCFAGATMKRLLQGHHDLERQLLDAKLHRFFGHLVPHHHHHDEDDDQQEDAGGSNWDTVVRGDSAPEEVHDAVAQRVSRREGVDHGSASKEQQEGESREYLTWRWWPTWHSLWHYHLREMGYIATTIQLLGVTLYGVTAVVVLPGIYGNLAWWQLLWAYWIPQAAASCCFIIASVMFTIMAQDRWYKPKWGAVSWWIGVHAFIGSCGFL